MTTTIQRGTQIAYIPGHADGNINHPDVEFGFVTSVKEDMAFCRFWSKTDRNQLRTLANSEGAWFHSLRIVNTRPQAEIDAWLEAIEGNAR